MASPPSSFTPGNYLLCSSSKKTLCSSTRCRFFLQCEGNCCSKEDRIFGIAGGWNYCRSSTLLLSSISKHQPHRDRSYNTRLTTGLTLGSMLRGWLVLTRRSWLLRRLTLISPTYSNTIPPSLVIDDLAGAFLILGCCRHLGGIEEGFPFPWTFESMFICFIF